MDHSAWEGEVMVVLLGELLGMELAVSQDSTVCMKSLPTKPDHRLDKAIRWVLRTAFGLPPVLIFSYTLYDILRHVPRSEEDYSIAFWNQSVVSKEGTITYSLDLGRLHFLDLLHIRL